MTAVDTKAELRRVDREVERCHRVARAAERLGNQDEARSLCERALALESQRHALIGLISRACSQCGSSDWIVSIVSSDGERLCSSCSLGRKAVRRGGAPTS
jgi:hypothetical protein